MQIEYALLFMASLIALVQALALWVLSGIRSSINELWEAVTHASKTIHEIDKRVAVVETSIERRLDPDVKNRL